MNIGEIRRVIEVEPIPRPEEAPIKEPSPDTPPVPVEPTKEPVGVPG